ncbi:uncharacterized protein JCM15063_006577 [Sporobolomyces koalae]|uniref:uncharacterized protein n=1 Tax=Sporobolomyces koalae TaxID=500713 RepID=UPI00316E2213
MGRLERSGKADEAEERLVDSRWTRFTVLDPYQRVTGGLQLNETRDEYFNHVLPPSDTSDIDEVFALAPMLPLSALESVRSDDSEAVRPITGSALNLALASGEVDYVEWYCYEIAAYAPSLEIAGDFGAFLESAQVAAMAKDASAEKVFKPYVQGLKKYAQEHE